MNGAPARGIAPRRPRRQHKHERQTEPEAEPEETEVKRPKVNPIFLWASQQEQRIVEVRCEDYDKRNRIKLTKTARGWRSIPRTASNMYPCALNSSDDTEIVSRNRKYDNEVEGIRNGLEEDRNDVHAQPKQIPNGHRNQCGTKKDRFDGVRLRTHHRDVYHSRKVELEKARNDQLLQPRVVLEQLHLEQLPDSMQSGHHSLLDQMEREGGEARDDDKQPEVDKEDLQEILNMLEATASPAMATDTPIADLPSPNSSKTCNNFERSFAESSIIDVHGFSEIDTSSGQRGESGYDRSPVSQCSNQAANDGTDAYSRNRSLDRSKFQKMRDFSGNREEFARDGYVSSDGEQRLGDLKTEVVPTLSREMLENFGEDDFESEDMPVLKCESKSMRDAAMNSGEDGNGLSKFTGATTASNCLLKWQNAMVITPVLPNIDDNYKNADNKTGVGTGDELTNSSRILDALRNTPGLSISIARKNNSETLKSDSTKVTSNGSVSPDLSKSQLIVTRAAPANANGASPLSIPSQKTAPLGLLISVPKEETLSQNATKTVTSFSDSGRTDLSPGQNFGPNQRFENVSEIARSQPQPRISQRNLPGLSITIPNYRYRSGNASSGLVVSPTKRRMDSPESTVSFGFPKHESDAKLSVLNGENDYDSQMEELKKRTDSLSYHSKPCSEASTAYKRIAGHFDEQMLEELRSQGALVSQSGLFSPRSKISEASTRSNRIQDLELFDEQVLEDLRSQGTVVSPQPSGMSCSPAPRRASSAYLERLLPSPPCSVSCSEDAKNDLTLKGILASPNRMDKSYDSDKFRIPGKEHETGSNEVAPNHPTTREPDIGRPSQDLKTLIGGSRRPASRESANDHKTDAHRATLNRLQGHEVRNSGRPMSSGDIHSSFFSEHVSPKRPLSVESPSTGQQTPLQFARNSMRNIKKHGATYVPSEMETVKDPATQLRELIRNCGHLIPDPLLVPRDHLPALAAAPYAQIPKLLASRPELRLPEALTRPELLRDPDLLVISLAHLQHVLDHGEGPVSRSNVHSLNRSQSVHSSDSQGDPRNPKQPKLSCKPIGTLMPAPIDLSANRRAEQYPYSQLLRVRGGLLKQEPEVTSTAGSPEDSQLWHPLFGSQKRQQQQQQQQQPQQQRQQDHTSWHRTTLAS